MLFQEIFPSQELNQYFLCLLHWQVGSLLLVPPDLKFRVWNLKIQGLKRIILYQSNTFAWMIDISLIGKLEWWHYRDWGTFYLPLEVCLLILLFAVSVEIWFFLIGCWARFVVIFILSVQQVSNSYVLHCSSGRDLGTR